MPSRDSRRRLLADHYGNVHYELYLAYRRLGQTELAQKALARSQTLRRSSLEHDQALVLGSPPPSLNRNEGNAIFVTRHV